MPARQHAPLLLSAAVGGAIGLAFSSAFWGILAFIVMGSFVEAALEVGERAARRSSARFEEVVRAHVRRAGITGWRPGGGGDLFSEPVLVIWHRLGKHEVYDQQGKLLAMGRRHEKHRASRIRELFGSGRIEWSTPHGRMLVTVSPDRRSNPRLLTASSPEDTEVGTITTAGERRGTISAGGETVGYLKRPARGRLLYRRGNRFHLYDARHAEVGRVTYQRLTARWNVIEVDVQTLAPLRNLVLAADAAVDYWTTPTG